MPEETEEKKPAKGQYSWDVYYKGKEGYAENIAFNADSVKDLQTARATITMWLQAIEAETLPRDKEGVKTGGWGRPTAKPAGDVPKTAAPGAAPVCPNDGADMKWKSGIAGPNAKNPGKEYGFWSCSNYPNCRGIVNA